MLHTRISAVRADRTFVRHGLREVDAGVLEAIDTRENLRPDHATQRFVSRIRAAVVDMPRLYCRDDAVRIECDERVTKSPLVAMSARRHVLGTCFHPLYRTTTRFLGCQRADRHLRIAGDLDSKTSPDVESFNA